MSEETEPSGGSCNHKHLLDEDAYQVGYCADDGDYYDDDMDDETFELPLKTRHLQTMNFSELDLVPNTTSGDKRVRFEKSDDFSTDFATEDALTMSKVSLHNKQLDPEPSKFPAEKKSEYSNSSSKKPHVEELIQHAHHMNRYLEHNMDKINTVRTEILNQELQPSAISEIPIATATPDSTSNFQLSDSEQPDTSNSYDIHNDTSHLSQATGSNQLQSYDKNKDHAIKDILSKAQLLTYPLSNNLSVANLAEEDGSNKQSNRKGDDDDDASSACTSLVSYTKDFQTIPNSPSTYDHVHDGRQDSILSTHSSLEIRRPSVSVSKEPTLEEIPELSAEEALSMFSETISMLLKLSSKLQDPVPDLPQHIPFIMKSSPSLSYEEYLERIHSKLMFSPVVYLTATYLLHELTLTRQQDSKLALSFPLKITQIHRIIIASIRLAAKLLEDFVHSHAYFSKVCGVSRKLLTRLELALLACLNYEGLMVTSKVFAATLKIYDELCEMTK